MSDSLRHSSSGVHMSVDDICKAIERITEDIDGFTISGGEPFLQSEELITLTDRLSAIYTDDIIIYTGYTLHQLKEEYGEAVERIINNVSVIIDGEYIEALNDGVGIRGSSNQNIHIFKNHDRHKDLLSKERSVQIIEHKNGMTVIGIP